MEMQNIRNQAEFEAKLKAREKAKIVKHEECAERWAEHTQNLPALENGDNVAIQNGGGNAPKRWDLRGKVVRYNGHDQYDVMVAGSRRITTRNTAHLRKIKIVVDIMANREALQLDPQSDPEKKGKNEEKNKDITDPGTQEKEVATTDPPPPPDIVGHRAGTNKGWRTGTCDSTN